MTVINTILTIYSWVIIGILLFFLFSIARFYERKSGRRSYYMAYIIPIVLFLLAAFRYAFLAPAISGDMWSDAMRFLGGITVGGFGFFLLRLMVGGRL